MSITAHDILVTYPAQKQTLEMLASITGMEARQQAVKMLHALLSANPQVLDLVQKDWSQLSHPSLLHGLLDYARQHSPDIPEESPLATSSEEVLACWLVQQGTNPWQTLHTGEDALDVAVDLGFGTLVRQLLEHPEAPSKEVLQKRQKTLHGRKVPWPHWLSYRNMPSLFETLVTAGWSPTVLDGAGWNALAWAERAPMVTHLVQNHPELASDPVAIQVAWTTRSTRKQTTPCNSIERSLPPALAAATPDSTQEGKQKWAGLVTELLAAKTPKPSRYERNPLQSVTKETIAAMDWSWRHEVASGKLKGTWTLPSAMCIAHLSQAKTLFVDQFKAMYAKMQSHPDLAAWMATPISPGVTNQTLWEFAMLTHAETASLASFPNVASPTPQERIANWATYLLWRRAPEALRVCQSQHWEKNLAHLASLSRDNADWMLPSMMKVVEAHIPVSNDKAAQETRKTVTSIMQDATAPRDLRQQAMQYLLTVISPSHMLPLNQFGNDFRVSAGVRCQILTEVIATLEKEPDLWVAGSHQECPLSDLVEPARYDPAVKHHIERSKLAPIVLQKGCWASWVERLVLSNTLSSSPTTTAPRRARL